MTRQYNNYEDMITFTRASTGTALRPVTYGDELVTNGTFDTDTTGWTAQLSATIASVSGELQVTASSSNNSGAFQVINGLTVGTVYIATAIGRRGTCTDVIRFGINGLGDVYSNSTSNTQLTYVFTATSTQCQLQGVIGGTSSNGQTAYFDNISLKEVTFDQPDGTLTLFNHPNNVPRIEYDADGNWKGLLIEESRTNLVTYSEDFSQWINSSSTDTAASTTSPDGESNGTLLTAVSSTYANIFINVTLSLNTEYCASVYMKAGSSSDSQILLFDPTAAVTTGGIRINWTDGVPSTLAYLGNGTDATYEDVGGGWYKVSFKSFSSAVNTSHRVIIYSDRADGINSIYIWGAQLEAGAFPTSYIPTSGSTATRATDDCGSLLFSNFGYNNQEGTFVVEFSYTDPDDSDTNYLISGGASARFFYNNTATSTWSTYDGVSAVTTTDVPQDGTVAKVAIAMSNSGTTTYLNGTLKGSNSSIKPQGNVGDYLFIGGTAGTTMINGHIKSIQYYPRRLSNAQLQALTS